MADTTTTSTTKNTKYIPLGSGQLYYQEFTGTIPADTTLETETNRLGYIEGGAQVTYKTTYKTFKDDLGLVSRTELTAEEASLKCDLIAWSMHDFPVFAGTASVDETTESGKRIVKIGGLGNDSKKSYVFRFLHKDAKYGDVRVTIVGKQTAGFTLSYKTDDAGKMALEVTAEAQDAKGTLVQYAETIV